MQLPSFNNRVHTKLTHARNGRKKKKTWSIRLHSTCSPRLVITARWGMRANPLKLAENPGMCMSSLDCTAPLHGGEGKAVISSELYFC